MRPDKEKFRFQQAKRAIGEGFRALEARMAFVCSMMTKQFIAFLQNFTQLRDAVDEKAAVWQKRVTKRNLATYLFHSMLREKKTRRRRHPPLLHN